MTDSFDPIEYLSFLRRHWRFGAATVTAALLATAAISWLLPQEYTAMATLIIEPPRASDPRAATAVSPIYLESLKAYEQFAASDSLFAKACDEFGLLKEPGAPPIESFKRRVLKVAKPKDTRLLRISVTLEDPELAHRLAEYLAGETVALSRSIAEEGDQVSLDNARAEMKNAGARLDQAREAYSRLAAGGEERVLNQELLTLAELKAQERADVAAGTATRTALENLDRDIAAVSARLADLRAREDRAAAAMRVDQDAFDAWRGRATALAASSGSWTEQLRIVDPGIVPQRPSFPNVPLFLAVAFVLSALASIGIVSLRFGLAQQRAKRLREEPPPEPTAIRVARGGTR